MKTIKKTIFAAIMFALICICMYIHSSAESNISVSWDFENGKTPNWKDLYITAKETIETDDNGNKYLKLNYTGSVSSSRKYYDVTVADIHAKTGIIQAEYDVMYTEAETEKNGDIQFKYRTGPGSTQTAMVTRFGKNMSYFRYHSENSLCAVKDLAYKTLDVEVGKWYSIKIIVDLDNATQSFFVLDRDTKELLAYNENVPTEKGNKEINMITFSSGTDMCIDNVRIFNPDKCTNATIYGEPYVSSATKTKYYMLGATANGELSVLPTGSVSWSLETPKDGISVDSSTGRIITGSRPEPGPVVLTAQKGTFTAKYVVYVIK